LYIVAGQLIIILQHVHVGELPVTIDLVSYDRDSGNHSITIFANSMRKEMANYTYTFIIQGIYMHQIIL
jgi:hypothetical protein